MEDLRIMREKLGHLFEKLNIPGNVSISLGEGIHEYKITLEGRKAEPFAGFYPQSIENCFTLFLVDTIINIGGIDTAYIEAIKFETNNFTPIQHIIVQGNERQIVYLQDDKDGNKKGDISYFKKSHLNEKDKREKPKFYPSLGFNYSSLLG